MRPATATPGSGRRWRWRGRAPEGAVHHLATTLRRLALALALALAAPPAPAAGPGTAAPARTASAAAARAWHARHGRSLQRQWGVDLKGIHPVSSGLMLRLDYQVLDPARAAALADKKVRPYLIDEATGTALAVPAMEKVGELRQTAPPVADRTYFMIFGNPGRLVKRGSRVTLVVGNLRAEGVVVD